MKRSLLLKEFVISSRIPDWYFKQLEHVNIKLTLLLLCVKIIQRNQLKLKYQNTMTELFDSPRESVDVWKLIIIQ